MKRILIPLFGLISLFALAAPQAQELNRIVAVVDEDVVTALELQARTKDIIRRLRDAGTRLPPRDTLEKQVLDRLILERLQLNRARQMGVRIEDGAVNNVVSNIAGENGLPLDQFRRTLERDGYDFAQFRENIRREMVISRLRQRLIKNRVKVSEQEARNYLGRVGSRDTMNKEFQLAHILIAVPQAPSPQQVQEAKQKAENILKELRQGADFSESAVAYSDGQQALKGGDLGWRKKGQLPTIFSDKVVNMERGDVSDLIRSPSGFHILKLVDERGGNKHVVQQTRARHILIRTNEVTSDGVAKARLERLRRRILNGADFGELAKAHSDDKGSAVQGGELGWASPGQMVPEFEEKMQQTPVGKISEPFKSSFGWHIVQPLERRDYDNTEEYRLSQAREQLHKRKADEEIEKWLRQLRDQAYVEYRLDS